MLDGFFTVAHIFKKFEENIQYICKLCSYVLYSVGVRVYCYEKLRLKKRDRRAVSLGSGALPRRRVSSFSLLRRARSCSNTCSTNTCHFTLSIGIQRGPCHRSLSHGVSLTSFLQASLSLHSFSSRVCSSSSLRIFFFSMSTNNWSFSFYTCIDAYTHTHKVEFRTIAGF